MSNTYKGKIGEQGAELDLALISFQSWLSQFPIDKISANEQTFAKSLLNEMKKEVVQTNYSFNDPRLVMIAFNMLKKNLISESEYDFTITEFMIVKQFWENTLDKNESEPLNNFLDAYLDISLSQGDITDNEKAILKENAEAIDVTLVKKYCPLFISEKLDDAIKYEIQEIDTSDVQEFDDEDVIISEIQDLEEEQEVDEILQGEEETIEQDENRVKINQEEFDLLEFINHSDFTSDGYGIKGVLEGDDAYSKKEQQRIARELSEKGVLSIDVSIINNKKVFEASVNKNYQEEDDTAYGGYRLVNLIFNGKNIEDYFGEEKTIEQREESVDAVLSDDELETLGFIVEDLQERIANKDGTEDEIETYGYIVEDLLARIENAKSGKFAFGGMTTNRNVFEFRIPIWAVSALINADLSGLEDDEIERLDQFVDDTIAKYGNAHFMLGDESDEVEFKRSNDIDGNIGGDVTKLYLISDKYYADGGDLDSLEEQLRKIEKLIGSPDYPSFLKGTKQYEAKQLREKIAQLKKQSKTETEPAPKPKPEPKPKVEVTQVDDSEIREQLRKKEKMLESPSYPEGLKDKLKKEIEQLKGRLSADKPKPEPKPEPAPKPKPEPKPKVEVEKVDDLEIREQLRKKEKMLESPSYPEGLKGKLRMEIEELKGRLSADKPKVVEIEEEFEEEESPIEKIKRSKKMLDIDEFEDEEESPIEKFKGKKSDSEQEEVREPKKRGRKPKPKPEIVEPKIPKKRGRKPKPKPEIVEPKVPQKRGRKPKPKLSLADFGISSKFNINDFI